MRYSSSQPPRSQSSRAAASGPRDTPSRRRHAAPPARPTRATTAGRARACRRSGGDTRASPSSGRRGSRRRRPGSPRAADGSTSTAPRRRQASSASSSPSATSASRSAPAMRGEMRQPHAGEGPRSSRRGTSGGRAWSALSARSPLWPRHRRQQQPAVVQRARHRAGVVEAPGERHDSRHRDTRPRVGLIAEVPQQRRRDAERSGRVRPGGRGHHARGERRGRAAARSAGRALERPRVADLVGRPAGGELVRVQVAEQHHPARAQPAPDVAVRVGTSSSRLLDAVSGLPATP